MTFIAKIAAKKLATTKSEVFFQDGNSASEVLTSWRHPATHWCVKTAAERNPFRSDQRWWNGQTFTSWKKSCTCSGFFFLKTAWISPLLGGVVAWAFKMHFSVSKNVHPFFVTRWISLDRRSQRSTSMEIPKTLTESYGRKIGECPSFNSPSSFSQMAKEFLIWKLASR